MEATQEISLAQAESALAACLELCDVDLSFFTLYNQIVRFYNPILSDYIKKSRSVVKECRTKVAAKLQGRDITPMSGALLKVVLGDKLYSWIGDGDSIMEMADDSFVVHATSATSEGLVDDSFLIEDPRDSATIEFAKVFKAGALTKKVLAPYCYCEKPAKVWGLGGKFNATQRNYVCAKPNSAKNPNCGWRMLEELLVRRFEDGIRVNTLNGPETRKYLPGIYQVFIQYINAQAKNESGYIYGVECYCSCSSDEPKKLNFRMEAYEEGAEEFERMVTHCDVCSKRYTICSLPYKAPNLLRFNIHDDSAEIVAAACNQIHKRTKNF